MPKKIKDLNTPTIPLTGGELLEMSQDDTSVKVDMNQVRDKLKEDFTEKNQSIISDKNYVRGSATGTTFIANPDFPIPSGVGLLNYGTVVFKKRIWIIGGEIDDGSESFIYDSHRKALASYDGITWEDVGDLNVEDGTALINAEIVEWKNKMWCVSPTVIQNVSTNREVYSSADGLNWSIESLMPIVDPATNQVSQQRLAVYDDKLWVSGGVEWPNFAVLKKIYYSEDGKTWLEAGTDSLPNSSGLVGHTFLSFNDKLWILGGMQPPWFTQDEAYWSEDGITWTQTTNPLPTTAQNADPGFVFDGKMWLGTVIQPDWTDYSGEFWSSPDGENWSVVVSDIENVQEVSHVPFNGRIYSIGGADASGIYTNDVHASELIFEGSMNIKYKKVSFAFTSDATSTFHIGNVIDNVVIGYMVQIDTPFDGTGVTTLEIGDTVVQDSIVTSGEVDLTTTGLTSDDKWVEYTSESSLIGTLTLSGASSGAGSILIKYI